ncbi:tripartite tricarboxylate transporter substrate binding protein [Variovorax guangxiensis]|uniref:Bug family tripartite tricarboxylate transporter substrate binding protein n=1 Tax=Variovorax guangxiensis TaxID=1775474 RepID=UPI002856E96D|nr:tripartite tricarboxylate transporter substrate binding protein [Variovorax guangxiensis]MDR6858610.1 tripartite-type tricarboxylate transporter receptor subunit TctC [Variovorax guangxiensis]
MFSTKLNRFKLAATLAGVCLAASGVDALAQAYPNKPITLISPVTTGGAIDAAMRSWVACAQEIAGQPIVLVPRPGANGVVAANAVKLAPADGYTFMIAGMSQTTITPFIYKKQPYDPLKDFHGVALFGDTPLVLVANTQSGIKNLKDLQSYARSRPKGMDIGHGGMGQTTHLLSAATVAKLGINSTLIPFAGEAAAATALMGGEIQAMVMVSGTATPFVESGKMVPLLTFSQQRLPRFPNVPTVVEELQDPTLTRSGWIGITAKAGTPQEAIDAAESWTKKCMDHAAFRQSLEQAMFAPYFVAQKEYGAVVRRDSEFWKTWISRLNISND